MSRTRVPFWTPPFGQAVRMALRPALTYLLFSLSGALVLVGTLVVYEHSTSELGLIAVSLMAGILGVITGQLVAILRVRGIPIYVASTIVIPACTASLALVPGAQFLIVPLYFFAFAFPCGFLSLQHRWELVASFWPAVGWIGAAVTILNAENRVHVWEENKASAWLVVPLIFLACFLVLWLFFLASKQALRVELWQALSGSARRRVSKKSEITAIPRRNVLPILILAAVLFLSTAILAPYLWRTGKHDGDGRSDSSETEKPKKPKKKKKKKTASGTESQSGQGDPQADGEGDDEEGEDEDETPPPKKPELDEKAVARELQRLAQAAKESALHLWPLLLLFVFYRPAKRGLLLRHLERPIVPTPPSERIENLWEVVRIAAQDRGFVLTPSDSIEDFLRRLEAAGALTPAVTEAAAIYERARYGFTLQRGETEAMKRAALTAAAELRRPLTFVEHVKIRWRRL